MRYFIFRNSIPPTTTVENLKTKVASAKGNIYCDLGFWGGVIPGNQVFVFFFALYDYEIRVFYEMPEQTITCSVQIKRLQFL